MFNKVDLPTTALLVILLSAHKSVTKVGGSHEYFVFPGVKVRKKFLQGCDIGILKETATSSGYILDCSAHTLTDPPPEFARELRWPVAHKPGYLASIFFSGLFADVSSYPKYKT